MAQNGNQTGKPGNEPVMDVRVSTDGLSAYLSVKTTGPDQTVTYEQVLDYLKQRGIAYGICEDSIRDFCDHKKYFIEITCARGKNPVDEDDGRLEYLFDTQKNMMPEKREDGTVDYRNLGIVQNVRKGDVLCRIIPPTPGCDGIDVFNHPIAHRKGRMPAFPTGRNTEVSEDGNVLSAAIDGCIEYKNMVLNINDVFIVHGNVDSASGNIDFLGSVTIQGDVREGFSVKSGGDIIVRGMVEGARLNAQGSISIAKGMNGMGKGKLTAGGNVTAKYFENSMISCGGDIYADVILNSIVMAGHSVVLRGRNGLLVGGKCTVGKQVYASSIGTDNNLKTEVVIDSPILNRLLLKSALEANLDNLKQQLSEEKEKETINANQIETINRVIDSGASALKAKMLLRTALAQQKQIKDKVQSLQEDVDLAEQAQNESPLDYNVVGIKTIFSGTKITIGSLSLQLIKDYSSMKFYASKGEIVSGPILPSDRIDY